jgi:hypothetical protein
VKNPDPTAQPADTDGVVKSQPRQITHEHGESASLRTVYSGLDPVASLDSQLSNDNSRGDIFISGRHSGMTSRCKLT